MTKEQKLKMALMHSSMTISQLAEKLGTSIQNLSQKMKRGTITDDEMARIADAIGCKWISEFRFNDGTVINMRDESNCGCNISVSNKIISLPKEMFDLFFQLYREADSDGIVNNVNYILKLTRHTQSELNELIERHIIIDTGHNAIQILDSDYAHIEN